MKYVIAVTRRHGISYWTGFATGFGCLHHAIKYNDKTTAELDKTKEVARWFQTKGFTISLYPNYAVPYTCEV